MNPTTKAAVTCSSSVARGVLALVAAIGAACSAAPVASTDAVDAEGDAALSSTPSRMALEPGHDVEGQLVAGTVGALRYSLAVQKGTTLDVSVTSKDCTPIFFLRVPGMFDGHWVKIAGKPSRDPSTMIADFATNDGPSALNGVPADGTVDITVTTQENADALRRHGSPVSACSLTINADDFEP
jgi:hypothetical protein